MLFHICTLLIQSSCVSNFSKSDYKRAAEVSAAICKKKKKKKVFKRCVRPDYFLVSLTWTVKTDVRLLLDVKTWKAIKWEIQIKQMISASVNLSLHHAVERILPKMCFCRRGLLVSKVKNLIVLSGERKTPFISPCRCRTPFSSQALTCRLYARSVAVSIFGIAGQWVLTTASPH